MQLDKIRNETERSNGSIPRSVEIESAYMSMRESVLKRFVTMEDFIKAKLFNMETYTDGFCKYYIPENSISDIKYVLAPNEYPYDVAKDIKHYVLWSITSLTREFIDDILLKTFPYCKDMFWFEQTKEQKSIKEIWHVHVFVKN